MIDTIWREWGTATVIGQAMYRVFCRGNNNSVANVLQTSLYNIVTAHGMMLLRKAVPLRHVGLQTFTKLFLSSNVPANLQIVDAKIFDPVPEPKMKEEHYYFPLLNVPATIDVLKFGSTTGELAEPAPLVKKIFEVPIRTDIINDVIRYIRHKRRQPKKTKRINEIRGSTKKPYAQKGGGRSQIGHKRNSSVRGGAKAHGPRLRDYSIDLNRKVRALGTMMALSAKHREGNLIIVDKLECEVSLLQSCNYKTI